MSSHGSLRDSENEGKKKSSDKKKKRRVFCHKCNKLCSGEVLKVQDRYFHTDCFYCKVCHKVLSSGGFYVRGEEYYCTTDYQKMFGTKCFVCRQYVEGEVVTALNNTYHKECFKCDRCKHTFTPGSTVTFDGEKYVCQDCLDASVTAPVRDYSNLEREVPPVNSNIYEPSSPYGSHFVTPYDDPHRKNKIKKVKCHKCHQYINDNTLLVAMGRYWHQWCFTCLECKRQMQGRFVARGEDIYCEAHYFKLYGVRCTVCNDYVTGKSLMANDSCYHFDCAKCAYCKRNFRHDQDLYKDTEGPRLWHQQCGLNSRQEYLNRTQSEDLAMQQSINKTNTSFDRTPKRNKTNSPETFQREDSATPTPPSYSEAVSVLSETSWRQAPSRSKHPRDLSQGSSDLSSQRDRIKSSAAITSPTHNNTLSASYRLQSLDIKNSPEDFSSSARIRRRVMSDMYNDNFKKAQEFFTSRENSTEVLYPPRSGTSPRPGTSPRSGTSPRLLSHSRQRSDLSSTSSGTDKHTSPINFSPQRSPVITDCATSTIKRTLKETHSHFTEPIDERQEIELSANNPSESDTSSSLHGVSSAPQLDLSLPDTSRRPLSFDDVPKREHNNTGEPRAYLQGQRKARTISDLNKGSPSEQQAVYPLQRLLVIPGEFQVYPRDVDRSRLEQHLSAEDFFLLFSMTKEEFSVLPPWKQGDMKKKAKLF